MTTSFVTRMTLPIDSLLPEVVRLTKEHRRLVIEAPPGAGKTTRVPAALLEAQTATGSIWVTEPRRLAARLVARRVAEERGEPLGQQVGYTVRFEDVTSESTRLRFVTEGILLRRLVTDPSLPGIATVVLDEFHERHLETDLLLTLLVQVQERLRPDLRLVVMSATLEGKRLARWLDDCPSVTSEGRLFPLTIQHADPFDERPLEKRVASAVRELLNDPAEGSILVFLPGAREIRRAGALLESLTLPRPFTLCSLHGEMPLDEQARVLVPGNLPKVVLSTNVAESSITVNGVTAVVDSGLARVASYSRSRGTLQLSVQKISRASGTQRAGRAGRVARGRVIRLYSRGDFDTRPEHAPPDIQRLDLSEARLLLASVALGDPAELRWFDAPPAEAWKEAQSLLARLGALGPTGVLTPVGRRMMDFPLAPRLARLLCDCEARGIGRLGAEVAGLLSERDLRLEQRVDVRRHPGAARSITSGPSDVLELLYRLELARSLNFVPNRLAREGIDHGAARAAHLAADRLGRLLRGHAPGPDTSETREEALALSLLTAFPDRVARRQKPGSLELTLSSGVSARLAETSTVVDAPWLVAVDLEDSSFAPGTSAARVTIASAIHPDWLLDVASEQLTLTTERRYVESTRRVEERSLMRYGSLVLDEGRRLATPGPETAEVLADVAEREGRLSDPTLLVLVARVQLLALHGFIDKVPDLSSTALRAHLVTALCSSIDLSPLDTRDWLGQQVAAEHPGLAEKLRRYTPLECRISPWRTTDIHYEADNPPWIASRLQDFFGRTETPTILDGRVNLCVKLLAPNQRPVQITTDLAGFWERHYPSIRRELMRRYPKHDWPLCGRTASPPPPPQRRPRH